MIHKGTRRAPDLHLLSAEALNEALAAKSRTKTVKKVKGKSSQNLHLSSEFLCVKSHAPSLLTKIIIIKKINICSCREMLMLNPVKPAVSE